MIRLPNWVGDAVMAEPALRELRRIFEQDRIIFAARPSVAGLFEGERLADNIITLGATRGFAQEIGDFVSDARALRREQFDLAVLLPNAFGAALQARAAKAKLIAGYPTDRRRSLLDLVVPFEAGYKTAHQVRYYLNIAAVIELELCGASRIDFGDARPTLHVSDEERSRGRSMLEEAGVNAARSSGILALCPGATNSRAKRWLPERFAAVSDRLAEQAGFQTIIVGGPGEIEVANEVSALMKTKAAVLAGRTSISDLKAVLANVSIVVSNDTGTAHVAAALGIATAVIFGPTEHYATRPLSERAIVVRKEVECSPCMLRDCPIDHRCMTRVEVEDVSSAAQEVLAGIA